MSTLNMREELDEKERKFHNKDDIMGMTLLTNPGYISSSRSIMFTSHLKQYVNLLNPDFPKVFTNYENIVGKYSTGYYQAKSNFKVVAKIQKYKDIDGYVYLLFLYDEENDRYTVIEKKIVENLTEKFGYVYDNSVMDSKEINDTVEKGEILYKSSSYDEHNNFCYGKNATFMYALENHTIEDAIICSRSFADSMVSKEVDLISVSLNDNDILCNLYGDNEEYKCFPNIGEYIKDKIICAKRRIHNDQILFDLKKSNLKKINYASDVIFFSEGRVIDINVYCNKSIEEVDDNIFNKQLRHYLLSQDAYYKEVYEVCNNIIESGSKYSTDIGFLMKRSKSILDERFKWKEEDGSIFSNIVIEFLVERDVGLATGQKISGRYGNKGVISKIVDDEDMPVLENGKRVDIIFNSLGVINRLNSFQLFESSINFICSRIEEKLKTLNNVKEKEEILFTLIEIFNKEQHKSLKDFYKSLNKELKAAFFRSVEEKGIYIHIRPLWEDESLFSRLYRIYETFPWIEPYKVYVNKFGRTIELMQRIPIGEMYVMKLKQTSKKGFSVRSTGSVSLKNVPEKTNKAKIHQELYSKTPIRFGDQENMNMVIGVDPSFVSDLHNYYRSSPVGRRYLGKELMTHTEEIDDIQRDKSVHKNRNIEILQAYLKSMGLALRFPKETEDIVSYEGRIESEEINKKLVIGYDYEIDDAKKRRLLDDKLKKKCFIGDRDEYDAIINNALENDKLRNKKIVIDTEELV